MAGIRESLLHQLRSTAMSVDLLLERRAWKFIILDAILLLQVAIAAFMGASDEGFFAMAVVLPLLILGVPLLADAVALERRAGTLDLALSSPQARFYFERRVFGLCLVMVLQGWLIVFAFRLNAAFHLWPPMIATVAVCALLGSAILFWATRLTSSGGVIFATLVTGLALWKWLSASPVFRFDDATGSITLVELLAFARQTAVVSIAAIILYLYAARRLANPEEIIQ